MVKKPPIVINASDLMREEEIPHAYSGEEQDIVLPMFRFPEHWMIQDWLTNTKFGEAFELGQALTDKKRLVPALKPKKSKLAFKYVLMGDAGIKELEEIILDYAKNIKYNT